MASRTRSWMTRSSASGAVASPSTALRVGPVSGRTARACALRLATVPPCDDGPEDDLQSAEPDRQEEVPRDRRREERQGAEEHEADPHDRHRAHRERPGGDHPDAIEEEP